MQFCLFLQLDAPEWHSKYTLLYYAGMHLFTLRGKLSQYRAVMRK